MLLVSLISYVDRNTLALLAPTILRETGLSGEQYGFIIAAFSVAYTVSNPLWGRILDRAGLRRGMTAAVVCWTVASISHAFAFGLWSFGIGPTANSQAIQEAAEPLTIFLMLRAFASGGAALTGVEAISDGVPAFQKPEWVNARRTLVIMGGILAALFLGLSILSTRTHAMSSRFRPEPVQR